MDFLADCFRAALPACHSKTVGEVIFIDDGLKVFSINHVNSTAPIPFNAVAGGLAEKDRKALVESVRIGASQWLDPATGVLRMVVPDQKPESGEQLFYVGFLGSTRDAIPSQHYLMPAVDTPAAIKRAHQLYELQPKRRKGASLRVLVGEPSARTGA